MTTNGITPPGEALDPRSSTPPPGAGDRSQPTAPAAGGAPGPGRRLRHKLGRLAHAKAVRLLGGAAVIALVLGVLAFGLVRLLGPAQKFTTIELPYVQDFTAMDPRRWFAGGGVWALREEMLAQNANLDKPAALYLPGKLAPEQPYHLSTYVTFTKPTQQAGINFNAQYPDMPKRRHQVTLARRPAAVPGQTPSATAGAEEKPMELVAGYTGEDGSFVKQVSVPFGPDTGEYRLDLYVLGNTYTVQINGQTLIERRPLFYPNGLVGFHTVGPARFDTLQITTASTEEPGEQVYISDFDQEPGGAGWVPFGGEWEIAGGELIQANPAAQDAGIGYEAGAFEEYGVLVTFRHLMGSGGGVLFNMVSPYQLEGAQVVRFSDQTDSVFWGYYDSAGTFTRQGYADVAPPGTEPQNLRVFVGAESYDVYLADQLLARVVPTGARSGSLPQGRSGGHIGLITSLSSVAFSRVEVFPLLHDASAGGTLAFAGTAPVAAGAVTTATAAASPTADPTATAAAAEAAAAAASPVPPAVGTPATGTPATGTPATGTPATGTPATAPSANAPPATAPPATGAPATASPATGTPATATPPGNGTPGRAAATPQRAAELDSDVAGTALVTPAATVIATVPAPATPALGPEDVPTATPSAATPSAATPSAATPSAATVVQGSAGGWHSEFRGTLAAAGWRPIAGQWRFDNDSLVQEDATGFDYAIVYRDDAFERFRYSTTFRHRDGNGAGLLFNLPDAKKLAGGHMVRYSERRPGGIFWGYYDATGKFVGQGYANVSPPGDASHTLQVVSGAKTYSVYLDDFLLAADVPLESARGYVGLVTVQTSAAFDSASVGAPPPPAGSAAPAAEATTAAQARTAPGVYNGTLGFADQAIVSGKWVVEDGIFRQTAPDPADTILNTGIYAANYTLEAAVLLATKPEVGGGFLLQAPERGRKPGATVVRFTNGGDGLFWGVYDEAGIFRGRAAVDLPEQPEGETGYVLRVEVQGKTIDVFVDDRQVIAGAALPQAQGSIGLLAHGGPVTFTDVQITVRGEEGAP